jgi:hypothetical protein
MKLTESELRAKLMDLLEFSTPYHYEHHIVKMLPQSGELDKAGNYWLRIGDEKTSKETLFCAHMDTVGQKAKRTNPFYYDGKLYATGKDVDCLGGDDRCGILCLLAMYNAEIPGTYLFHVGEEKGTIGAKFVAKEFDLSTFKRAVQFDRRGTTSVITQMMGGCKVCSDEFSLELCKQLGIGFKQDDGGSYTDVYEYQDKIPEVTNISCGYHNEHSEKETIEIDWLINQFIPRLYEVKWDTLPVTRDHTADNCVYADYFGHGGNWQGGGRWGRNRYGSSYSSNRYGNIHEFDDFDTGEYRNSKGCYGGGGGNGSIVSSTRLANGEIVKQTFNSFDEYIEYKAKQDPNYCSKYLTQDQQNVIKALKSLNKTASNEVEEKEKKDDTLELKSELEQLQELNKAFESSIDDDGDDFLGISAADNGVKAFSPEDFKTCDLCNERNFDCKQYISHGNEVTICEACLDFARCAEFGMDIKLIAEDEDDEEEDGANAIPVA